MATGSTINKLKPYLLMVLLQIGISGMYIITIASLKKGMNHYVLVVYRNAVAAAVMAPFAWWFERNARPKMTLSVFFKIALSGLIEPVLDQNLSYVAAKNTSAGFTAALANIIPAVTFVLALLFRMEKLKLGSKRSCAKIVGTLATVAGTMLMIFYQGPIVSGAHRSRSADATAGSKWLIGTLERVASCVCWADFYIVQASALEEYPAELSLTTWICSMGALQSAAVTLVMERGKPNIWSVGLDERLFTAVYSGVVCSGLAYYLQGIVMKERGPVFVTAFSPLCTIFTTVMGCIFFKEDVTLGRIIGAVIIVTGLYSLLWGKGKDVRSTANIDQEDVLNLPVSDVGENTLPTKVMELPKN